MSLNALLEAMQLTDCLGRGTCLSVYLLGVQQVALRHEVFDGCLLLVRRLAVLLYLRLQCRCPLPQFGCLLFLLVQTLCCVLLLALQLQCLLDVSLRLQIGGVERVSLGEPVYPGPLLLDGCLFSFDVLLSGLQVRCQFEVLFLHVELLTLRLLQCYAGSGQVSQALSLSDCPLPVV